MRQPSMRDDRLLVRLDPTDDPARLPVPKDHVARPVSAREVLAIGRELRLARVACDRVACETLLALCGEARLVKGEKGGRGRTGVLLERVAAEDEDLVVERLHRHPFLCKARSQ